VVRPFRSDIGAPVGQYFDGIWFGRELPTFGQMEIGALLMPPLREKE
jgi:hypothetical protein